MSEDHSAEKDVCEHDWKVEPCGRHEHCHRCDEYRIIPSAKPSAPDLDDPIDEYRQAQLERSNEARGIVR